MTLYLDTSTLVKLYLDEPDAGDIQGLVDGAQVLATASIAYAEARATLARRRRDRSMTPSEVIKAVKQLNADWSRFLVIDASEALAFEAGRLADVHNLRGADAIHLAAFQELLTRCPDDDVEFSCADDRLNRAAHKETRRCSTFGSSCIS